MSWTFAEERPIYWEEPPEQIAITNAETGEWDAYMLTSRAMRMIRDAKDDANWLHAELHGVELEARKAELGAVAMTEENMAAHGWVRERTCRIKEDADTGCFMTCSECGAIQPEEWTVYYCWSCGARVVEK